MIRVLLVEDDPVIRDTTRYFLNSQQNYEVVCAETGGEALSHARENFDVILMDILLPDTNGMDLCQRLRSWHHCPIIFTSCLDDTDTVVRALELGGDDFLAKPYNHKVLLARIMANIRRVQMDAAEPSVNGYHCAAFTLDSNSHCVEKDGRSIHLADMEFRILSLFVRYPNTFFTANELYQKILGQGKPRRRAHGAGAHPQSAQQDRAGPGKAHLPEKCLGRGMCSGRMASRSFDLRQNLKDR